MSTSQAEFESIGDNCEQLPVPPTRGPRSHRRLPLKDAQVGVAQVGDAQVGPATAVALPDPPPPRLPAYEPAVAGSSQWTAFARASPARVALDRAMTGGVLDPDERPQPLPPLEGGLPPAFFDDTYYAAAYGDLVWPDEDEADEYFSPSRLALGAELRRAADRRYLVASSAPGQLDALRKIFAPVPYARLLGWSTDDPSVLWNHYVAYGLPAGVPPTPLFQTATYRRDIAARSLPPPHMGEPLVLHWLRIGASAGVVPCRLFDERFYLSENPDVAQSGMLGFQHFLTSGMNELRWPTVWFAPGWYHAQPSHAGGPHYESYISVGVHEGRMPSPLVAYIMARLGGDVPFTADIYASFVAASLRWRSRIRPRAIHALTAMFVPQWHPPADNPVQQFLTYLREGVPAGTPPGPLFDAVVYRRRAAAAGLPACGRDEDAVEHWLEHGHAARIVPTERFDEAAYQADNIDIKRGGIWGFEHFATSGVHEGRAASRAPMFRIRDTLPTTAEDALPKLYRHWHSLDFPGSAKDLGGQIPAAAHRRLDGFLRSKQLADIFADAQAVDPAVGESATIRSFLLPPFFDGTALRHAEIRQRLAATHYDSVVCVPWIRTGGADLVAGLLSRALLRVRPHEKVLVLRTDYGHFERANWLPAGADVVDISDHTTALPPEYAEEVLRTLLRGVTAKRVFNVNSRLCWITLRDHGRNLAATLHTYAYLFCWDQTPTGVRVGYPTDFYAETAGHMTAFLTDTNYLRDELTAMYRLPQQARDRIVPMFTPAQSPARTPSIARIVERRAAPASRKVVLWAGRLDRQKRFDLVQDIARLMPDVLFRCWGAALLDAPPDLLALPANMQMEGSFDSFDDLPLADAGAWLFTALWEGMPTTIIELAARGVPVVASAVGGVPELIQRETGWLVPPTASTQDYVDALRDALRAPAEATRRAEALQQHAANIHNTTAYDLALQRLLSAEDAT